MTVFPNPWRAAAFNVTEQMRFVRKHGMALANAYANDAGTTIGGLPKTEPKREQRTVILNKTIQVGVGGGVVGGGSSGNGPPE
jgi:hypothetical protein